MRFWMLRHLLGRQSRRRGRRARPSPRRTARRWRRSDSIAAGFSSLDSTPARPLTIACTSLQVFGPLHERQRDPVDAELEPEVEVGAVLRGQRRDRQQHRRHVDALALGQHAAGDDAGLGEIGAAARPRAGGSCRRRAAGRCPACSAAKISGCGSGARLASPGAGSQVEPERLRRPRASTGPSAKVPTRSFGPCRSSRMAIGRPVSRLDAADDVEALAVLLVRAVAEVAAGRRRRRPRTARGWWRGSELAGPSVATILAWRCAVHGGPARLPQRMKPVLTNFER